MYFSGQKTFKEKFKEQGENEGFGTKVDTAPLKERHLGILNIVSERKRKFGFQHA